MKSELITATKSKIVNAMKSKIGKVILFILRPLLIGSIVGIVLAKFLIYPIFGKPIDQDIHLQCTPNWVQFLTETVSLKESPSLPTYEIAGANGLLDGDFSALFYIEKMYTRLDSSINIFDKSLKKNIDLNVDLPAYLTIIRLDNNPCLIYTEIILKNSKEGFYIVEKKMSKSDSILSTKPHPRLINRNDTPLSFNLPDNRLVSIKFVERSVSETGTYAIPQEFTISTPYAPHQGRYGQRLSLSNANTALFKFDLNSDTITDIEDILIYSNNIFTDIDNASIEFGRSTRDGSFALGMEKLTYTTQIFLDRKTVNNPFDFAFSFNKNDSLKSNFILTGGASFIFFFAPNGRFSLGNEHFKIEATDYIQFSGKFHHRIIFTPNSLPEFYVDGIAESCKMNGIELVPTLWSKADAEIRGGIIGGFLGFLLSILVTYFSRRA